MKDCKNQNCVSCRNQPEPLAQWEIDLLTGPEGAVIHMYPAEGMTSCDIKLDDGKNHLINSDIKNVSCGDCKINYLTYMNEQLAAQVQSQKEELTSARAVTMNLRAANHDLSVELVDKSRRLTRARAEAARLTNTNRRLSHEVQDLRGPWIYYVDPHTGQEMRRL